MKVAVDLEPDEHRLIEIVRQLKHGVGFGDISTIITQREIVTIKKTETFKI